MGRNPLKTAEKKKIAMLKAQGLTDHAIAKAIGRSNHTVTAALRTPGVVADVADYQERITGKYEQMAERLMDAISEEDILKASLQQKVIAAATCTDKARLISGQSTVNAAVVLAAAVRSSWDEEFTGHRSEQNDTQD